MRTFLYATMIIVAMLITGCSTQSQEENQSRASQSSSIHSSQPSSVWDGSWTRIDKQTFWQNDTYFDHEYYFPSIAFEHPSHWKFSCCGDVDSGSNHLLCYSERFDPKTQSCTSYLVKILTHALGGCPSGKWDCSIDTIVPKTAQQKYTDEVNLIRANTGATILPPYPLPALGTDAFVYARHENSRSYLINLGDGVIDIEFMLSDAVYDTLIEEFLSKIVRDE